jgi:hypothetical protein
MDCNTARLLLCFDRPGATDLGPEGKQALEAHLQECSRCRRSWQTERRADEALATAVGEVAVPPALAGRLKTRLGAERRSWYRRFLVRRGRDLAIAAALVAAMIVGGRYWAYWHRPVLDLEDLVNAQLDLEPSQIQGLIKDTLHVQAALPRNLNFGFLYSYSVQEIKGRRVPRLVFKSGPNLAEVLILTDDQFNLGKSALKPRFGSGNITMELRLDPNDPKIGYLIIYSGEPIDDWLVTGEPEVAA